MALFMISLFGCCYFLLALRCGDEYAFRDESDICMMIGKRVYANASTLVRLNASILAYNLFLNFFV